ncbi:MAG: MFS transporter [Rhodospirillaceae bacterium]|nr:MFS transporter [Rhodospirillaceae bacterium]
MPPDPTPLAPRFSPGVVIACAAMAVTVAMGVRQSFGLFLTPISMDLDIGRQTFGLAVAIQNLLFGLGQPFVGALADEGKAARLVMIGAFVYAAGLVLTAFAAGPVMLNLSLGLLVGLAMSATTFVAVFGPVARAVAPEHRSRALGLVTAGGSLGQFLVVPAVQAFLSSFGWRTSFVIMAGLVALIALLALGLRERGAPAVAAKSSLKDALREAAGDRSYWLLNAGFFVCGFHIAFVGTHLPAYLRDNNLNLETGAQALALIGLFNIFGSYLFGTWGDTWSKKWLLSAIYFARGITMIVFLAVPLSETSALMFAATFGFLWLGTVPLTSGLVTLIYGLRYSSTLYGIVFLSHQIGSFLGAWLAGLAFDVSGSYAAIWAASIVLAALAALIHIPIAERPLRPAPLKPAEAV